MGSQRIGFDNEKYLRSSTTTPRGHRAPQDPGGLRHHLRLRRAEDNRRPGRVGHHIPTPGDEAGLRKLGVNLTCDPNFASKDLFVD
jgi:hypothetical protein